MVETSHFGNMKEPDFEKQRQERIEETRKKFLKDYPFVEPYIEMVKFEPIGNSVSTDYSKVPPEIFAMIRKARGRQ